jgi:ABC-type transporter Mla subunit MlaD
MATTERRTEFVVGLFLFIGLILLGALIVQFGRFGDRVRGHYPITVVFDDASGLIKGSEVRMGGARIGKVEEHPELT